MGLKVVRVGVQDRLRLLISQCQREGWGVGKQVMH